MSIDADLARAREIVAAHKNLCVKQEVRRILCATGPLYPQLVPGVRMWSDGKQTVQCPQRPGPDYFPVAVHVKEAA